MKNKLFQALFLAVLFTACSGGNDSPTPAANSQVAPAAIIIPKDTFRGFNSPVQATPAINSTPAQPVATQQPAPVATAAKGMNPAHGLPGHRCDIAVGAPLSSPVQNQPVISQPTTNKNTAITPTVVSTPQEVVTAPGMNPPHGKPNHRCDIAVGAPLNSKPVPNKIEPVKKDSGS